MNSTDFKKFYGGLIPLVLFCMFSVNAFANKASVGSSILWDQNSIAGATLNDWIPFQETPFKAPETKDKSHLSLLEITAHPSDKTVCENGGTTFSVSANAAVGYQWLVSSNAGSSYDTIKIAGSAPIYSGFNSETLTLTSIGIVNNNYKYRCVVSAIDSIATSNPATLTVNPDVVSSVTISASQNNVCAGTSVTISAIPVGGGTAPTYQWYKNSIAVGTGSNYTYVPLNGDIVYVVMTSNASCVTGSPATSSQITMLVNPNTVASVSIIASQNNICPGTSVTFTATPNSGGTSPVYQWYKNGISVGNGNTYTDVPNNGDNVYVVMTSNAPCVSGSPATSSPIIMIVNSTVVASVTISASQNSICAGTSVTFTPTPVGGGATPTYQWFKNNIPVATGNTYSYIPLNNDVIFVLMTSSSSCATGSPASSGSIVMVVSPNVAASVTINASQNNVCS
jgi:hypothetical protein